MQNDWWQILAHISPLSDSKKVIKDAEEFPGDQIEEVLQNIADCEEKPEGCGNMAEDYEGKIADCEVDPDKSHEGLQSSLHMYTRWRAWNLATRLNKLLNWSEPIVQPALHSRRYALGGYVSFLT